MRILDKGQAVLRLEDLGFLPETRGALRDVVPQAVRHDPRDRPDRFGKVDDALRHAQHAQHSPTATSSRSRIRSSTGCPASTRCRSTRRPASRSRRRCGRSCVPTPTSCSSVRSATSETAVIAHRGRAHRSPRALDAAHQRRRVDAACGSSRWASSRSSSRARSTAWSPSASPAGSATSARSRTSRPRPSCSRSGWPMRGARAGEWPTLHRAIGCRSCGRTGYKGRFAHPRGDDRVARRSSA